jgi:hypothetical protein
MVDAMEEAGKHLQTAKDKAAIARKAVEGHPGEGEVEDEDVWDTIHWALYDIDYALAKATWTTKDYMNQMVDAADEGYDDLVEELVDARNGLTEFREDLSESRPSKAIHHWFSSMEDRLEAMIARLRDGGGD